MAGVNKVFPPQKQVLKNIYLSFFYGAKIGVIGLNGSGKSSVLKIIAGIDKSYQGEVVFSPGYSVGYLAQEPSIFRSLTVLDNLLLVMEQTQVPRKLWNQKLTELISEFSLEKVVNTLGNQVSGGERRRTEIARSLAAGINGPKFLFLDEPFAGVDPIAVAGIQKIIAKLRDRNMGVLITDHNVRETLAVTDRAYIMREGQVLASGSTEEMYSNPLVRQYYLGSNFQF